MVNSSHDWWGCGVHPPKRGCLHDFHPGRIRAEQGLNLAVLLCAFQPEQNDGSVGFVVVVAVVAAAVVAYAYVQFVVVVLRPEKYITYV